MTILIGITFPSLIFHKGSIRRNVSFVTHHLAFILLLEAVILQASTVKIGKDCGCRTVGSEENRLMQMARCSVMVKALCYKLEGRGFDT
jgi:hypothetical protein